MARIEESIEIDERYFGEIDQNQNRKCLVIKNRNRIILESTQLYSIHTVEFHSVVISKIFPLDFLAKIPSKYFFH